MIPQMTSDVIMWILVDAILAVIIISLISRLLRLAKRRRVGKTSERVVGWTTIFDQLLKRSDGSTAVKKTFKIILNDLERLTGLRLPRSLTAMEVVNKLCTRFPDEIGERLIKLYEIYEPVRFGGRNPDRGDVWEFRSNLNELEKILYREIVGGLK
ncbi:MAG: hypothetical protein DRN68_05600 [Thaumarchaeota archaeon]|nr:MAG: hypothetical protein DRN68_05600 [Nitrososphaerota archaeon]